jgi:(p)ppGpp synthase/HD superfamily hydrolase
MSSLNRAIEIAREAHLGQVDKSGMDYINHPLRVMSLCETETEKIVGVLHDVIEDSNFTFEYLINEGFSDEVIEALRCITKLSEEENYDSFIERVKQNNLAVKVKICDLTDNLDVRRLKTITEKDFIRLSKYLHAYHSLRGDI